MNIKEIKQALEAEFRKHFADGKLFELPMPLFERKDNAHKAFASVLFRGQDTVDHQIAEGVKALAYKLANHLYTNTNQMRFQYNITVIVNERFELTDDNENRFLDITAELRYLKQENSR